MRAPREVPLTDRERSYVHGYTFDRSAESRSAEDDGVFCYTFFKGVGTH